MPNLTIIAAAIGLVAVATAAVADPDSPLDSSALVDQRQDQEPAAQWPGLEQTDPDDRACRDTIRRVRAESGLPELEQPSAGAEEALLFNAVDQRIEGCPVLVMARDASDIRPVPEIENRVRLIPLADR